MLTRTENALYTTPNQQILFCSVATIAIAKKVIEVKNTFEGAVKKGLFTRPRDKGEIILSGHGLLVFEFSLLWV